MKNSELSNSLMYGTWRLNRYSHRAHKDITSHFKHVIERGISFFDTAESYGNGTAEMLLGRAMKGVRDNITVGTKFSHHHSTRDLILKHFEKSRRRLDTDYIDIYFQHWPNPRTSLQEAIDTLCELKDKKLIKAIGVSNWEVEHFEKISNPEVIEYAQIAYNPLWRKAEKELFSIFEKNNIACLSYSPLAQGTLLKDIAPNDESPRSKLVFLHRQYRGILSNIKEVICEEAKKAGMSPAQLLLMWNVLKPSVHKAIISTSSDEQLHELLDSNMTVDLHEACKKIDAVTNPCIDLFADYPSMWDWRP